MSDAVTKLAGLQVLVLNWRDVRHSQAGGAEQYMHEICRRWVTAGADVTWLTAREPMAPRREVIDGIRVLRAGGTLSVYMRAASRLARTSRFYDVIIDCQNGIPFFSPVFAAAETPIVQVVHHVHQDQFATRFSPPMAAVGRWLEGRAARAVYRDRAIAAVSASTRHELRRQLGFRGPIFVVPNGNTAGPETVNITRTARATTPTIAVVSRLVPHKRLDLLLEHLASVAVAVPDLRVDVIGDGPELSRLRQLTDERGLAGVVQWHGRQPDAVRDELLSRAWVTTSTSAAEGWGCTVIEAAAWGVPCVALRAPGIRDSVVDGTTGWLVNEPADYGLALIAALTELADPDRADLLARSCTAWAGCFDWDRSAELLAGVVSHEIGAKQARQHPAGQRRSARPDIAVVARFPAASLTTPGASFRVTDEVVIDGDEIRVLLGGCDELDAQAALRRVGVEKADVRLATRYDLLAGPQGLPGAFADSEAHPAAAR